MSLAAFLAELDHLAQQAIGAFASASDAAALEAARVDFLGAKSGRLKAAQKSLGSVPPADKPAAGKRFNEVKTAVEAAFAAAGERLQQTGSRTSGEAFDVSLPGTPLRLGHLHPITQTIEELKDIMGRLGFSVAEGPEIEDEWHNFEALNIPAAHPARDPLENFYLATAKRGHGPAERAAAAAQPDEHGADPGHGKDAAAGADHLAGRVYRPDTADATHYPDVPSDRRLADRPPRDDGRPEERAAAVRRELPGSDVHIRFRPSFFPFTEPSVEVDMSWHDAGADCAGSKWAGRAWSIPTCCGPSATIPRR